MNESIENRNESVSGEINAPKWIYWFSLASPVLILISLFPFFEVPEWLETISGMIGIFNSCILGPVLAFLIFFLFSFRKRPAVKEIISKVIVINIIGMILFSCASMWVIDSRIENAKERCTPLISAVDKYNSEKGEYPENLQVLINEKYLIEIPATEMSGWNDFSYIKVAEDGINEYIISFRCATVPFYFYSAAYATFIYSNGEWGKTEPKD
ncbi:MAG: hypothetical protein PHV06_11785 [bacterium]|nr:hypothetical protein [bacterium]